MNADHSAPQDPRELPPTARRILDAAQTILAERGYSELTMSALEHESGANRALVAYYFGSKAGLVTALIDGIFVNPQVGLVEEIRAEPPGAERTARFLEWQQRVSSSDRTNRMLYELLPHALHDPEVRARFAEEYRAYRTVDADCLTTSATDRDSCDADAMAAVAIAVVEGLAMQRALDPEGFDHERAWRFWRSLIGGFLGLPTD
jgi:AcrR family transcriptional regulator